VNHADDAAAASPLRSGSFLVLLAYRIFAILSYQIVAVTVGWHIYQLTHDPLALGLIGLAEVIPYFCTAPFAGYLVDHLPRRRLGMVACAGLAITATILMAIAAGWLPSNGPALIYAAIVGVSPRSISKPAFAISRISKFCSFPTTAFAPTIESRAPSAIKAVSAMS